MSLEFFADKHVAIRVDVTTFADISVGVTSLTRRIKPITNTFSFIGSVSTETEILGYTEIISVELDRVFGDAANDFIYSMTEQTGVDCKTEIFIYDINDSGTVPGSHEGKIYPVSVAVTRLSGDKSGKTPFYGLSADIYINGEGVFGERTVGA